jgi:hypothetical protein
MTGIWYLGKRIGWFTQQEITSVQTEITKEYTKKVLAELNQFWYNAEWETGHFDFSDTEGFRRVIFSPTTFHFLENPNNASFLTRLSNYGEKCFIWKNLHGMMLSMMLAQNGDILALANKIDTFFPDKEDIAYKRCFVILQNEMQRRWLSFSHQKATNTVSRVDTFVKNNSVELYKQLYYDVFSPESTHSLGLTEWDVFVELGTFFDIQFQKKSENEKYKRASLENISLSNTNSTSFIQTLASLVFTAMTSDREKYNQVKSRAVSKYEKLSPELTEMQNRFAVIFALIEEIEETLVPTSFWEETHEDINQEKQPEITDDDQIAVLYMICVSDLVEKAIAEWNTTLIANINERAKGLLELTWGISKVSKDIPHQSLDVSRMSQFQSDFQKSIQEQFEKPDFLKELQGVLWISWGFWNAWKAFAKKYSIPVWNTTEPLWTHYARKLWLNEKTQKAFSDYIKTILPRDYSQKPSAEILVFDTVLDNTSEKVASTIQVSRKSIKPLSIKDFLTPLSHKKDQWVYSQLENLARLIKKTSPEHYSPNSFWESWVNFAKQTKLQVPSVEYAGKAWIYYQKLLSLKNSRKETFMEHVCKELWFSGII